MLSDDAFQKLLFDLFCTWHDVQRHYDPPLTHTEEEKMFKVKNMICKLLGEIDVRVKRLTANLETSEQQEFVEEWTMLTWNVLCITSRLQNSLSTNVRSPEDRMIFAKLNEALVELVNQNSWKEVKPPTAVDVPPEMFGAYTEHLVTTMRRLHDLYRALKNIQHLSQEETENFLRWLNEYAEQHLYPFIELFKTFCNEHCVRLWKDLRAAQIRRMLDLQPMQDEHVTRLACFYSHMMYTLAILSARLQGFRYELTVNKKVFGLLDPVKPLSDAVFSALELLMSDCILSAEPSTNPILVTNNLFSINCGALARGVVFKQFDIQIVTEEVAEHIQSEMRRQKMLQQPSPISNVPSAALLAMKQASGTKRSNSTTNQPTENPGNTSHKKTDVNSKEIITIYPIFHSKNRYWAATYPHLLCTTRQKGRQSTHNSFQDLSPNALLDIKSNGKRPIFYFHIRATMFSPSGKFSDAHTLSLPVTIATRRNQDCQVQRMMSSYTATCFWLYGCTIQDGLLLQWVETGMRWEHFKKLFMQHFKVNAEVNRGLHDRDFDLLQYKLQCNDCISSEPGARVSGAASMPNSSVTAARILPSLGIVTFKNMLCPHLRYECGSTKVQFSVWRGMLELLQIFQDPKTNVRKLWEKNLILGFLEFDQVASILEAHQSALIMRVSFITGGTICFTVKSNAHSLQKGATAPMHLEPLDLKKLQAKCLKDYLRDIAVAEKVKYIINSNFEPVLISDVITEFNDRPGYMEELESSRDIASNVGHSGDIANMQHIRFTAMRIAVVTCKLKPPSADGLLELENAAAGIKVASPTPTTNGISSSSSVGLPATSSSNDEFVRELIQLSNFHGKTKNEVMELLEQAPEVLFTASISRFSPTPQVSSLPPATPMEQTPPPSVFNHLMDSQINSIQPPFSMPNPAQGFGMLSPYFSSQTSFDGNGCGPGSFDQL